MSEEQVTEKPRGRRRRRALGILLSVVVLVAVLLGGTLWFMVGREVAAPAWLREKIETRIATALPGIRVDFGRMSLLIQESGLARIILWDVAIRNDMGVMIAQLNDIEAGIAPVSLLNREWELREAQVSGAFVTLQRDEQGRLGLALGDAFAAGTQVPDIGQMVAQVDALALDPRLAKLDLFEADALTLRYEDLRARRGWTADGGRLRLAREGDRLRLSGDVALLSGGDGVATVEVDTSSQIGENGFDFSVMLDGLASEDIATQSPALAWLDALDAPISGALKSSLAPDGSLGVMEASLEIGRGVLQPNREANPLRFHDARTAFTYDPAAGVMRFSEIRLSSPLVNARAIGVTQLDVAQPGQLPKALTAQFSLKDLRLAKGTVLDREISLSGADMAFRLALQPFRVDLGSLTITDPAFPIRAKGWFEAGKDGWQVSLDAQAAETDAVQVKDYWPAQLVPRTRDWVMRAVEKGQVTDVIFALRARQGEKHPMTYFDLGIRDATVAYAPNLPAISGGAGRLTIYDRRLGLRLDEGRVDMGEAGVLRLDGSEFVIPDLQVKPPDGVLDLKVRGPLSAALAFVDNDQWQVLRKVGKDATLATGEVDLSGTVKLPLGEGITFDDVKLALAGTARDVRSAKAVPGKVLAAEKLDVALDNRALRIEGAVDASGLPATGVWTQPLDGGGSRLAATVDVTAKSLASLGITLPDGMVRGAGKGALTLELPKGGTPTFAVESNLAGLGLSVPQIGWSLAPGTKGRFTVSGSLGPQVKIDAMALKGAGLEAEGRVVLTASNAFDRLEFSRLKVGDWMEAVGRLKSRGKQAPAVEIVSGRIDLRSAPFGASGSSSGGEGDGAPIALTLGSLRVTDNIELKDFRGNFVTTRGLEGRFDARLGGMTPVQGQAIPQNGGSAFRIFGEDAGDVLKAANLLKTVQDGTFQLDLAPVRGQAGSFDGLLTIREARLQKMPAIASLLDAISVVGLLDQMNGPGIFFSDIEARFRLTPSRVIVTESSAVGPSMGVSLDGYYDLASGGMDMQGVISPIYVVNAIGRLIAPRKGEGLIGFNFDLRGTVGAPKVSVNPLSALTPGMFRDIFRRPPPKLSQ